MSNLRIPFKARYYVDYKKIVLTIYLFGGERDHTWAFSWLHAQGTLLMMLRSSDMVNEAQASIPSKELINSLISNKNYKSLNQNLKNMYLI